ncbi:MULTISPECIES: hypothetical protein [Streptomyces]|uniref:Uncharacterized protein n=2 Tax=Streptomyces TaxID=1883 RepID=A0ABV9IM21_9ACTN
MICPNCQARLLRKERTGSVCAACGRPFALDPRADGRGMHDTRIRRVAEKITDGGRRQVTVTQFWYLARTGNPSWPAAPETGRPGWAGFWAGAVLAAGLVGLGLAVRGVPHGGLLWCAGAVVAAIVYLVAKGEPSRPARRARAYVVPSLRDFRTKLCVRWVETYGSLPPGIVDDEQSPDPRAGGDPGRQPETVELLCPDRAVRVFLSANGFPRRLNLTLAAETEELSGTAPVVVLHDAGVRGLQLVADVRASRPGRAVVDAGLPVSMVLGNRRAVTLHEDPPARTLREQPDWLRRTAQLAPKEAEWLTQGWSSPVAAVPPALLEPAVERAVQEARAAAGRQRRQAAAVGFMSWPAASPATGEGREPT